MALSDISHLLAEGASEASATWDWLSGEAQLILSTYLLFLATFLGVLIEIYKITQIEHKLDTLIRLVRAIRRPIRYRKARRVALAEGRIKDDAAHHRIPAPGTLAEDNLIHHEYPSGNTGHFK